MKTKTILILGLLFGFFSACTPKVAKKVVKEPEKKVVKKVNDDEPRPTPCTMFRDIPDGEEVKEYYVIYKQFMKTKEWDDAYEYWSMAVRKAPGSNGRVKYQFDDGVDIFKHYYDLEKDVNNRKRWIDSINWVYNKRAECFGEDAYLNGLKAFDFYYYFNDDVSQDTIFELFAKAVDVKKEKTDYFVINPFSKLIYDRFVDGKSDTIETKHYANILINAVDYGTANCKGEECKTWDMIEDYAPKLLDNFEAIKDFYLSSYYKKKYFSLFEDSDKDCETVNLVYRKLKWGGCNLEHPQFSELKELKNGKCYVAPPTPGPLRQAYNYYNEGEYNEAIKSFNRFINDTDDSAKKAKYLILIAKIYYRDLRNFPLARKYALKAASYRSNWGEPYILIGKLYASSGPICGPGRGWDSQIVTWPAIDKFKYAKKIDPSVTRDANKLISSYQKYMPNVEDIFQRTLKEGSKFKIGCWINETTTIRAAKQN